MPHQNFETLLLNERRINRVDGGCHTVRRGSFRIPLVEETPRRDDSIEWQRSTGCRLSDTDIITYGVDATNSVDITAYRILGRRVWKWRRL